MNILKRIGLGAAVWAIIYVLLTILMFGAKMEAGIGLCIITFLVIIILTWWISGYAKIKNVSDAFVVGIIFILTAIILDYLGVVLPKFNVSIFSDWSVWIGYALLLLTPIVKTSIARK